jgi:hypothetical protein
MNKQNIFKNLIKGSFITIQVKCEFLEAVYNKVIDKFTYLSQYFAVK